jgi:hypothetical protein
VSLQARFGRTQTETREGFWADFPRAHSTGLIAIPARKGSRRPSKSNLCVRSLFPFLHAKAVELDFVQPLGSRRRLFDPAGKAAEGRSAEGASRFCFGLGATSQRVSLNV